MIDWWGVFGYFILLVYLVSIEIDMEGTVPPDDDPPQEMGDPEIEVSSPLLLHAS